MRQVLATRIFTDEETEDWEVSQDLTGTSNQGWDAKPGSPASEPIGLTVITLHYLSWSPAEIYGSPKYIEILI